MSNLVFKGWGTVDAAQNTIAQSINWAAAGVSASRRLSCRPMLMIAAGGLSEG